MAVESEIIFSEELQSWLQPGDVCLRYHQEEAHHTTSYWTGTRWTSPQPGFDNEASYQRTLNAQAKYVSFWRHFQNSRLCRIRTLYTTPLYPGDENSKVYKARLYPGIGIDIPGWGGHFFVLAVLTDTAGQSFVEVLAWASCETEEEQAAYQDYAGNHWCVLGNTLGLPEKLSDCTEGFERLFLMRDYPEVFGQ